MIDLHTRVANTVLCLLIAWTMTAHSQEGVILLHGLCRTTRSMEPMAIALRQAGFTVLNVGYPSRSASIESLSKSTLPRALAHETLAKCSRIHFVTHSMGGLLVRAYYSGQRDPRIGRAGMLGPPNQGSEVVDRLGHWRIYQWLNGPAGNDMGTGQDALPHALGTVTLELGVIAGDRSINWINSALIPGPDDGKVAVRATAIDGMSDHLTIHAAHPFLMRDRRAIEATIRFLETGSFASKTR